MNVTATVARRRAVAIAASLALVACGGAPEERALGDSTAEATLSAFHDSGGGSIIGYENLTDQVLDADAVVRGAFVSVQEGPTESGGGASIDYLRLRLRVSEIFRTSGYPDIETGNTITISVVRPPTMSFEQAADLLGSNVDGVHMLFYVPRLSERLVEEAPGDDVFIYQTDDSMAFAGDSDQAITHLVIPELESATTFEEFVSLVEQASASLASTPQPDEVIGLG